MILFALSAFLLLFSALSLPVFLVVIGVRQYLWWSSKDAGQVLPLQRPKGPHLT